MRHLAGILGRITRLIWPPVMVVPGEAIDERHKPINWAQEDPIKRRGLRRVVARHTRASIPLYSRTGTTSSREPNLLLEDGPADRPAAPRPSDLLLFSETISGDF